MKDENYDVFKDDDFGINRTRDFLTRFWRQILLEVNMDPLTLTEKMDAFMRNPRNRHIMRGKSIQSLRGNLRKALLKEDKLSWRNFERGLVLLNPVSAEFEVKLKWGNGQTTVHKTIVPVSDPGFGDDGNGEGI